VLKQKDVGILLLIINHSKRIIEKTNGLTYEEFNSDIDIKELSAFHILQIGELAKKLSKDFILIYNSVPWKDIKGMMDRLVHGYETISFTRVWEVAINDIPILLDYCYSILKQKQES